MLHRGTSCPITVEGPVTSSACSPRSRRLPPRTAARCLMPRYRFYLYSVSENCNVVFIPLWPRSYPPLPGPLTCTASIAEDQAQGEVENLWQGSPRSHFSPVPTDQTTPPTAAGPAPHLQFRSQPCKKAGMWNKKHIFLWSSAKELILIVCRTLSLKSTI